MFAHLNVRKNRKVMDMQPHNHYHYETKLPDTIYIKPRGIYWADS